MAIALNPYIHFNGEAQDAVDFYKSVFGGTLDISRYKDIPSSGTPKEFDEHIMHALLKSDDIQLMVSDSGPMGVKKGNNMSVSLSGPEKDAKKLRTYFNALKEGGTIIVGLEKAPWGDEFGMLTDKFGITWMVNIGDAV